MILPMEKGTAIVIEEEIRRKKKAKPRALDSGRAPELKEEVEEDKGFELSERAAQAAQVNMSARLAKGNCHCD
jgi:hypothetical protein